MLNFPEVSVIVPVYNAAEYLGKCVESILDQKYRSLELILVDDGSTDESLDIARKYERLDSRIRVLHKENSGASSARNVGLDCARGKWVLFVDADDWIQDDTLAVIEESPDSDLIFFGFNEWESGRKKVKRIVDKSYDGTADIDSALTSLFESSEGYFGFTVNKFYNKDLIDKHHLRFSPNLLIKEDEEFIIRYCKYIDSVFISAATPYNYRILSGSLSHSDRRFKHMNALALKTDEDLTDYPFGKLKCSIKNAVYRYFFKGVLESRVNNSTDYALDCWDSFVKNDKQYLSPDNKLYTLFRIPVKSLRRQCLKFALLNPASRFFRVSFYKHLLYSIYIKIK